MDNKKNKFSFLPKEEQSEVLVQNPCSRNVPEVCGLVHAQQGAAPPAGGPVYVRQEGASSAGGPFHVSQDLDGCPSLGADRREPLSVSQDLGGCPCVGEDRREEVAAAQDSQVLCTSLQVGSDYDDGSAEVKENIKVSHHLVLASSQLANLSNVDKRLVLPLTAQDEQRPPLVVVYAVEVQAVGDESVHYVLLTDAPAKPQKGSRL